MVTAENDPTGLWDVLYALNLNPKEHSVQGQEDCPTNWPQPQRKSLRANTLSLSNITEHLSDHIFDRTICGVNQNGIWSLD